MTAPEKVAVSEILGNLAMGTMKSLTNASIIHRSFDVGSKSKDCAPPLFSTQLIADFKIQVIQQKSNSF
jgi:hypothetical protein